MGSMVVERVQDIAKSVMKFSVSIPEEFVRLESEQPGITTVHGKELGVPTIDFSNPDEERVVYAIAEACKSCGMFQIVNHGIPDEVIKKLQEVGGEFFRLPHEEKEVYAKPPGSKSVEGYGTKLQKEADGKKGWVDHLFHKIWPPSSIDYQFWPKKPSSYREANEEYAKYMREVVKQLFRSLSLGLGLEAGEMEKAFGGEMLEYLLKINYYPPCPRPDLALGVVAHTDMSTLTILVPNHVPGLQAFSDGRWFNVKYIPNALVVHIGDQIEILSNGIYKSVLHRTTVDKVEARMSWPVFIEPPLDVEIGSHPKLVGHDNLPKYKTKKYGDYVYCKLNKLPQ